MTPSSQPDDELVKYDSIVQRIVWNARDRFLEHRKGGKSGWDHPRMWEDQRPPLELAIEEIGEVREASTMLRRLAEAGDVLNYLVFDFSAFHNKELEAKR